MEFRCSDPNAQVLAGNVLATLNSFKLVPSVGRRLVERHNLALDRVLPTAYLPVQRWLDALADIQQEVGPNTVRRVGATIVDTAPLPPHMKTREIVLASLNDIFYSYHKGDVGRYVVSTDQQGIITVHCETPYPRNFEWGIVDGIARTARFPGKRYTVEFIDLGGNATRTCTLRAQPGV